MIIIAGHMNVPAEKRDGVVAAHRDLVRRARDFDGCLELAITADSVDSTRVNNLEIWRDQNALKAWRAVADAPEMDEPDEVEVNRYDAEDGGDLFQDGDQ